TRATHCPYTTLFRSRPLTMDDRPVSSDETRAADSGCILPIVRGPSSVVWFKKSATTSVKPNGYSSCGKCPQLRNTTRREPLISRSEEHTSELQSREN